MRAAVVGRLYQIADFVAGQLCLERECIVRLVIDVFHAWHNLHDGVGYLLAMEVHSCRMGLYHCRIGVYIHYQSGQEISLAVDKAIGVVVGTYQADRFAHPIRRADTILPETVRQLTDAKRQNAHGDRAYLIVSTPRISPLWL